MSVSSIASSRHLRILDILKRKGTVRVQDLSRMLDVSPVTVRRDLEYLYQKGLLERHHGGAKLVSVPLNKMPERNFFEKGGYMITEKQAIAKKALELIVDDEIIFVNSGSTTLFFIDALKEKRLKIFTNNAGAVAAELGPEVELVLLGGEYREQSRSLVGIMTLEALKNINSNKTFLGTNGFTLEKGLMTTVQQECSINKAMINNTNGPVIVLADHTKIDRVSNFVSTSTDTIDVLVTDSGCSPDKIEQFSDRGIRVLVAEV